MTSQTYRIQWRWMQAGTALVVHETTDVVAENRAGARRVAEDTVLKGRPGANITKIQRIRRRPLTGPHARKKAA